MSDPQLMKLFNFDESDQQSNRNGHISEKQIEALKYEDASSNNVYYINETEAILSIEQIEKPFKP
ncbi:MAG: hypothetical protein IPO22_15190 [Anaerolineales bacterium]|jgi:hypothetical protein|nr:hypothetical protein [Anaerolineales bacterium]